jgi:hypothetical protein
MQQLAIPADTPAPTPEASLNDDVFMNRLRKAWVARLTDASGSINFPGTVDPKQPEWQEWAIQLGRQRCKDDPQIATEVRLRAKADCPLVTIQWEKENIDYLTKALTRLTTRFVKKPSPGEYRAETRFDHPEHQIAVLFYAWCGADKSEQSSLRSVPNSVTGREFLWDGTNTPSDPSNPGSPF